jgi:hypothetical protein
VRTLILPIAALVAACGAEPEGPARPTAEIQDSAGVRIVVNPAPDAAGPRFTLSAEPLATIGVVEGAPEYQLTRASAVRLSDETIVVFNGGTQELRFYDATGQYLRTVGREGEGPGEFKQASLAGRLAGDSVLVLDGGSSRVTVVGPGGEVRSYPLSSELGFAPVLEGALANGRMLFALRTLPNFQAPPGVLRESQAVAWLEPSGSVQRLGEFPGMEVSRVGGAAFPVPLAPGMAVAANGGRAAVGDNATYSVNVYDDTGTLLQVVRLNRPPTPAQPGDFELGLPAILRLDSAGGRRQTSFTVTLDQMPHHETLPAYGDVRLDYAGNLWVGDYAVEWLAQPRTWSMFDPEGIYVGRLEVPDRSTVLDIGEDWILLRTLDDLDVERVVLYGLTPPTP